MTFRTPTPEELKKIRGQMTGIESIPFFDVPEYEDIKMIKLL